MDLEKYTPIRCCKTNVSLFIGDLVENEKGQCGTLVWDDFWNKYIIKTETGGNIYATSYKKIKDLHDYNIDTTKVECRRNPYKNR